MKLIATRPVRVFVERKWQNCKLEDTQIGKIPAHRREDISWKGCYYTIQPNEEFKFDRSNDYDRCYFYLENGAEFAINCGNYKTWAERDGVKLA